MAVFCIPPKYVDKLTGAISNGAITIEKLVDSSSKTRRELFASLTDGDLGKFINTEFERALASNRKTALQDWAKGVTSFKKDASKSNLIKKINDLSEKNLLDPATEKAFLQDLVADKLGVTVSPEEIRIIDSMAKKVQEAEKPLGDNAGDPQYQKQLVKFFKEKENIDKYLQSLNPSNLLPITTSTIGRGMMLASLKSPILNIHSNTIVGFTEALSRRMADGVKGTDYTLAKDYVKQAWDVYQKTGYDITRMMSMEDVGVSGSNFMGEILHSQGKGPVRKVARVVEDVVFKQLMGAPDVAFAATHFADTVNILSLKMAKGDKAAARELMVDSMRLNPKTADGAILREQAILDAQTATFTNKSWATKLSGGIRKVLNNLSPRLRLGDYIYPFVKTPANVIALGMDYAGGGAVKSLIKLSDALIKKKKPDPMVLREIVMDATRSGVGLVAAWMISQSLDDDDFEGAYERSKKQQYELEGTKPNSFKYGGKSISIDYLGPIGVSLAAMMYARQYNSLPEKTYAFVKGVAKGALELPGIKETSKGIQEAMYAKDVDLKSTVKSTGAYLINEIKSRLVPSFMGDIAKATDKYERVTNKSPVSPLKSIIPGLRQTLPIKKDVFARPIETESPLSVITTGSRVKSLKEDDVTKKLDELYSIEGNQVRFTDWNTSNGKKLSKFKEKVGDEAYDKARDEYGAQLRGILEKMVGSESFNKMPLRKQLKKIENLDNEIIDRTFKKYNFKYRPEKKR